MEFGLLPMNRLRKQKTNRRQGSLLLLNIAHLPRGRQEMNKIFPSIRLKISGGACKNVHILLVAEKKWRREKVLNLINKINLHKVNVKPSYSIFCMRPCMYRILILHLSFIFQAKAICKKHFNTILFFFGLTIYQILPLPCTSI